MYSKRINYIIVGLFVVGMLTAIVASTALLTGRTGPTDRYFAVFDNVAEVKFGTQVRYEGYLIGQVERITPIFGDGDMRFRVAVSIAQGWRIPTDSVARVGSSGILAAKTIDVTGGGARDSVPVGGKIASAASADLFAIVANTAAEFSELNRDSIKPLLNRFTHLIDTVAQDTPRITGELATFAERLNAGLTPLEEILADENVEAIQHIIFNAEKMTGTLTDSSANLAGTLRTLDNMANNLDQLVAGNKDNVDRALKDLQYTLASIARTVGTIVHNLDGTSRNMNEFSRLIRSNPGLLLDGTPRAAVSPADATQQSLAR